MSLYGVKDAMALNMFVGHISTCVCNCGSNASGVTLMPMLICSNGPIHSCLPAATLITGRCMRPAEEKRKMPGAGEPAAVECEKTAISSLSNTG